MTGELSSNWKKLQAQIKAESASKPAPPKRKAGDSGLGGQVSRKKQKQNQRQEPAARQSAKPPSESLTKRPKQMGNAQSSKVDPVPPGSKQGISPSLALWASGNDISPEQLAEAYGLGLQSNSLLTESPARPNEGLATGFELGKYLAIDCEMVGVGEGGHEDMLARASIVDFHGRQVYDSYVRPQEPVVDWRTHVSGVSPRHMAKARKFDDVQNQIAELLKGRILVGHDVKHDLKVLRLDHPPKQIRDTAKFSGFRKYGYGPKPALRVLVRELLGLEIQTGQHSSIEDARVAMLLFRKHKPAFDVEHANRYTDGTKSKPKGKKTKRR
ncbi:3'-5' exonuclease [Madurella fahalii]|uniref:RNA exonuclease 4 n=1 Tax=Madurella fahalii TaxID=1157608 RepID=A0ABQ0GG63_9PEZI